MTPGSFPWLRLGVSIGLLIGLAIMLDTSEVLARLQGLDIRWAALALAVTLVQFAISAWRRRFTAHRLGAPLPYAAALREYYLGSFLNQLLPGGVLGHATPAVRHGRDAGTLGIAIRAVFLERVSGQIALFLVAAAAIAASPTLIRNTWALWRDGDPALPASPAMALLLLGCGLALGWRHRLVREALQRLLHDSRRALFTARALPIQLTTSLLVVATYLGVYLLAARALGVTTPVAVLLPPMCLSLLAMLVPLSIAGWGLRETAAAIAWPLAGLDAADGVAISVVYGALVLISSLPGGLILLAGLYRARRDTTASNGK